MALRRVRLSAGEGCLCIQHPSPAWGSQAFLLLRILRCSFPLLASPGALAARSSERSTALVLKGWLTHHLLSVLALASFGGVFTTAAQGQWADVPRIDSAGDFLSTKVQGNRGYYQQKYWLVVDRDPEGLNCRPVGGGAALVKLDYGGIVMTRIESAETNSITLREGLPWLNVTLTRLSSPVLDLRSGAERIGSYHCQVRAHSDFVAPINLSAIDELRRCELDE